MKQKTEPTRLKRHLSWAIPLVAAPIIYVCAGLALGRMNAGIVGKEQISGGLLVLGLALMAVTLLGPATALIFAAIGGFKTFRHWRRTGGHFTKREILMANRQSFSAQGWQQAQRLQQQIVRRQIPDSIHVWDVVPNAGEVFFMDTTADYARYYGVDVAYSQTSGFFYGRPAFVLAGLGATVLNNAARRKSTENHAAAQWRECQPCRLLVSNQRLLCQVGGTWLSFYFLGITAVYPEIENWALITQYDSAAPLRLSGVNVPSAALFTLLATHGSEAVGNHPSLQKLRVGAVGPVP